MSKERFIGVDAARSGGDESVVAVIEKVGSRWHLIYLKGWHNQDSITLLNKVTRVADKIEWTRMAIDAIGVGAGVYDQLRQKYGRRVHAFAASNRPIGDDLEKKRFANLKAQSFWELAEAFRRGEFAIPDHEDLREQLCSMGLDRDQYGKLRVVDPNSSPDYADALNIAFAVAVLLRSRVWVGR